MLPQTILKESPSPNKINKVTDSQKTQLKTSHKRICPNLFVRKKNPFPNKKSAKNFPDAPVSGMVHILPRHFPLIHLAIFHFSPKILGKSSTPFGGTLGKSQNFIGKRNVSAAVSGLVPPAQAQRYPPRLPKGN